MIKVLNGELILGLSLILQDSMGVVVISSTEVWLQEWMGLHAINPVLGLLQGLGNGKILIPFVPDRSLEEEKSLAVSDAVNVEVHWLLSSKEWVSVQVLNDELLQLWKSLLQEVDGILVSVFFHHWCPESIHDFVVLEHLEFLFDCLN